MTIIVRGFVCMLCSIMESGKNSVTFISSTALANESYNSLCICLRVFQRYVEYQRYAFHFMQLKSLVIQNILMS